MQDVATSQRLRLELFLLCVSSLALLAERRKEMQDPPRLAEEIDKQRSRVSAPLLDPCE